ncbi:Predicted oxidoreductase [Altererythrobacter xiamenensis]|uniref:Predicted oxidoreductase n=1 Tax=Altererythrobacter xiamenensis TaxID=1316679 RepID=A0A1Y6F2F7_9SPHN|nr:aldo/keto reductase [Altererythrobacter xiamenensis]SMQ69078.1 Predicted oxidoreductase [Altererythrobacter xiamenensis]
MTDPARIVIGCEQLGGTDWGELDPVEVSAAISHAFDAGLTIFDTADVYGLGESERRLAKALGPRRHAATIITKAGVRWEQTGGRAKTYKDNSPGYLAAALDASLARLRVEAIDLYFIHWPDESASIEETLEFCNGAVQSGKIKAFGFSNFADAAVRHGAERGMSAIQASFNLLSSAEERASFEKWKELGLHRFGYGALAQGLLTGKYDLASTFNGDDRRHRLPHFRAENWPRTVEALKAIENLAADAGLSVGQSAIQAARQSGFVDHVIVGVKNVRQVDELVQLDSHRLNMSDLAPLYEGIGWQKA